MTRPTRIRWRKGATKVTRWSYLPHTPQDRLAMLETIGVAGVEELFADIPQEVRLRRPLRLPPPLSEMEMTAKSYCIVPRMSIFQCPVRFSSPC